MKRFTFSLLLLPQLLSAQGNWCSTTDKINEAIALDPSLRNHLHELASQGAQATVHAKVQITIPVVIHIIHDNGVGNISDAQAQSALDVLNRDYNRTNLDAVNTRNTSTAPFAPIAANVGITFILAKLDPNGNCTNGIERRSAPGLTYNTGDECKSTANGGLSAWPVNKYLNIWVVNSINSSGSAGIVLGYAYLPYFPNGNNYGILIRADRMGTIGLSVDSGRTLTHEMGHTLGLSHTFDSGFGGGASGCHADDCSNNGDYACDTPPSDVATFNCSTSQNSCTQIPTNDDFGIDVLDQIENYMSYDGGCQNMFSLGQKNIILNAFTTSSNLQGVIANSNLIATGVNNAVTFCKADFSSNKTVACVGDAVQYTDYSFTGPTNWAWTFTGGDISSSTLQNPVVVYNTPGVYSVTLTSGDGVGSDVETKTNYITVLSPDASPIPYVEGFESYGTFPDNNNWYVNNNSGSAAWNISTLAARSGTKSVRLGNFGQNGNFSDELVSGPLDLSILQPTETITLSFRYAYKKKTTGDNERLRVAINTNCGNGTWNTRKTLSGSALSSLTQTTTYVPVAADWVTSHVTNLISLYYLDNFRFKFIFDSDNGNNIFLDDINIYQGTSSNEMVLVGLEESTAINSSVQLSPNPTTTELNCTFEVEENQEMLVSIIDAAGKTIQAHKINAVSGKNIVYLETGTLSAGKYNLVVQSKTGKSNHPFVK